MANVFILNLNGAIILNNFLFESLIIIKLLLYRWLPAVRIEFIPYFVQKWKFGPKSRI